MKMVDLKVEGTVVTLYFLGVKIFEQVMDIKQLRVQKIKNYWEEDEK